MVEVNNDTPQKMPILIRVSSVTIMVMGIVGLLFFVVAATYLLYNPYFLNNNGTSSGQYLHLDMYIVILLILHIGIIFSSLLIIRLKKIGIYLFLSAFLSMLATEFIFEDKLMLNNMVIGLIIVFVIILYYRRFK